MLGADRETFSTRCMAGPWGVACVLDNLLGVHEDTKPWPLKIVCEAHHLATHLYVQQRLRRLQQAGGWQRFIAYPGKRKQGD